MAGPTLRTAEGGEQVKLPNSDRGNDKHGDNRSHHVLQILSRVAHLSVTQFLINYRQPAGCPGRLRSSERCARFISHTSPSTYDRGLQFFGLDFVVEIDIRYFLVAKFEKQTDGTRRRERRKS